MLKGSGYLLALSFMSYMCEIFFNTIMGALLFLELHRGVRSHPLTSPGYAPGHLHKTDTQCSPGAYECNLYNTDTSLRRAPTMVPVLYYGSTETIWDVPTRADIESVSDRGSVSIAPSPRRPGNHAESHPRGPGAVRSQK